MQKKVFDLSLNDFGPYNKEYLGVCHIADKEKGATFSVELFPGFFRRSVLASHSSSDAGLKMWGANADLTRFSYRYELMWKDMVYCDADFVITDNSRCDITCTFVNNTDKPQSVNMNLCAALKYPTLKSGREVLGFIIPYVAVLADGCRFVDAVDYFAINCTETLASDGRYLAEAYQKGATGKSTAISGNYFFSKDHFLKYKVRKEENELLVRCMVDEDTEITVSLGNWSERVKLKASSEFNVASLSLPEHCEGDIIKISPTGSKVTLDSLIFGGDVSSTVFKEMPYSTEAQRKLEENKMTLSYENINTEYTIEWSEPIEMLRKYYCNDIGRTLSLCIHDHVSSVLRSKDSLCVYENVLSKPLFIEPNESKVLHYSVYINDTPRGKKKPELYSVNSNSDGAPYVFSQNMMAYNTFLNVVYPIYTRRGYIKHNTPGRIWDSLYSWDSGFIGLGLATADFDRAFDCLNTYLTPLNDPHSPYIFHGSVVPTQIFLYQYLFSKYPEQRDRLKEIYPMVKQLFDFYSKMDKESGQLKSKLLKTWDIFYNSGGWDDYPPQKYLHSLKKDDAKASVANTSPVITTAITVLTAKILRNIASQLGEVDTADFDEAIEKYSSALLKYAWNEETGYFSYVVHGDDGLPKEFLKYRDGVDYNLGFDGIYPYISYITDKAQSERIISNVLDGLMTPIGIGAVDTRAPYYKNDGYWNGSVWMPHQWILWRSLLDHNEGELAFKIADTALSIWKREVDESYSCFEHFMSANGRGSGFHQFSGLSTPVLLFFESYYKPGTVTLGFCSVVVEERFGDDNTSLYMKCICTTDESVALICLSEKKSYRFIVNGREASAKKMTSGAYEVPISKGENIIIAE